MGVRRTRLPLALLATVAAAGVATLVLRPRSGLIEPVHVNAEAYFTRAELKRAEDFRDTQRLLALAGLALTGGTLAVLTWRAPGRFPEALARRPIVGGAAAGAGLAVALTLTTLPVAAMAHHRSFDVGLSTQTWGPWLVDVAKSTGIEVVFATLGGAAALALVRRFRRNWWLPGGACVVAFGLITTWLFPVVIDPIFNKFEPLKAGRLRSEVLELADRAGVKVRQVYRVDASRRTTASNAYVNGLGHTKRVVLYDNLIDDFPDDQVRMVVAHELGHQKHDDVIRGLAWLAIVAPAGMLLGQRLAEVIGRRQGLADHRRRPGPAVLPAIALSLGLVSFGLGCASNVLSRRVEASADAFSLRLTDDPAAHIALERRLAVSNIGDPDPPALFQALFGTHPTTVQRIGIGEAYARRH